MAIPICVVAPTPRTQGIYKVRYSDTSGALVAEFDAWSTLIFRHAVNELDSCTLTLNGKDPRISLLEKNGILEVWRKVPGYTPNAVPLERRRADDWYVEWDGIAVDFQHDIYENERNLYSVLSDGHLSLIANREVLWYAGSPEGTKQDYPAQTAIYEFVRQNCGPYATLANGRLVTGTITGLAVPTDVGGGGLWSGGRSWRNVLEVIQEIANLHDIDFDVISTSGNTWAFHTYINQQGQDRTLRNLVPATGMNGEGNAPVIFSVANGNVSRATHRITRRGSANVVVALGQGEESSRDYWPHIDETVIDARRVNQREVTRNASGQATSSALRSYAESAAAELQETEDFTFTPRTVGSTIYGVHYWWGDRCTAIFEDLVQHKRLTGVTVNVGAQGETFGEWQFKTVSVPTRR